MLTLISQPDALTFSRNPVLFRLQATDDDGIPYGPVGASAQVTMNAGGLQVDDTLRVIWVDELGATKFIIFTGKATPTLDTHVQAQPSGLTDAEYFELIAAQMAANPLLSPFITTAYTSPSSGLHRITFTAINTAEAFEVTLNISGIDSGSSPTTTATAAVADNTPENYTLLFDVFFEDAYDSSSFELVANLSSKPDATGYMSFDLSGLLDKHCQRSMAMPPLPAFDNAEPVLADVIRRYYVRYRQDYEGIFDNPLDTSGAWEYLEISKLLMGGIDQALWPTVDFFGDLSITNSLLTWQPDGATVGPTQPKYIAWYNYTDANKQVAIEHVRTREADVLTASFAHDTVVDPVTVPPGGVALIPVGFAELGFTGTDILKYSVRVLDGESDFEGGSPEYLSQSRSFYVDYLHHESERYIVYLNSFSCPETLRCTGIHDKDLSVESEEAQRTLPIGYDRHAAELFAYDFDWSNPLTYRSGYLSKAELDALQELLIYRRAWELDTDGWTPLLLRGKSFPITQTLQYLHSLAFQAVRALVPKNYTPANALAGATEAAPSLWELEDGTGFFELEDATDKWLLETS